jgi:hypothetical protein
MTLRSAVRASAIPRRPPGAAGHALALALVALIALPVFAPPVSAQVASATVSEILANPAAYFGQTVTVVGDVDDVLGPRAFTIDDDDLLSDDELPVVSARPMQDRLGGPFDPTPLGGRAVWIRGTVHQFNLGAFEDRLGLDLDDDRFAEFAGQPAIIADSIVPTRRVLDPQAATVDDIAQYPGLYYGETVTVSGEVDELLGPRAFTIEDADLLFDEQVLVVSARPLRDRDGRSLDVSALGDREVRVTGTVRPFDPATFEQEVGFDLDDALFAGRVGKPAIIARSIHLPPPR